MKDKKKVDTFRVRAKIIQWANHVKIPGRIDSAENARAVLVYICSVCGLNPCKAGFLESWYPLSTIRTDLDMGYGTFSRALEKLQEQNWVVKTYPDKRIKGRVVIGLNLRIHFTRTSGQLVVLTYPLIQISGQVNIQFTRISGQPIIHLTRRSGQHILQEHTKDNSRMRVRESETTVKVHEESCKEEAGRPATPEEMLESIKRHLPELHKKIMREKMKTGE